MPKTLKSIPENSDCCIAFETDIYDDVADKYNVNYVCSA